MQQGPRQRKRVSPTPCRQLDEAARRHGLRVHYPEPELCTDNGAMIALAAAMRLQAGCAALQRDGAFGVLPRWPLGEA